MQCEIVVPVKNMDSCRCFYRDTLALGAAVTDSVNMVQFQLNEYTMLTLELDDSPKYPPHHSFVRLRPENFELVRANLLRQEIPLVPYDDTVINEWFRTSDPDGNIILLAKAE